MTQLVVDGQVAVDLGDTELCEIVRSAPVGSCAARTAFATLYARHHGLAMAVARRILGDRDRAEEAVSEAFAKTLRALVSGRGPTDSFKSYILAAVRGEAYRRPAIERLVDDVTDEALAQLPDARHGDPGASLSERDQVVRAFSTLRARWRDVLYLLEVEGVSVATAAREMGTNSAAVVSLAHRAREGLRTAYLQQYVEVAHPQCGSYARDLAQHVRGGLGPRVSGRLRRHLAVCARCAAQAGRLERLNEHLRVSLAPACAALGVLGASSRSQRRLAAAGTGSRTRSVARRALAVLGAGLLAFAVLNPLARLAAPEVPGQQHVLSPTVAATGGGAPGEEPPSPSNPGGGEPGPVPSAAPLHHGERPGGDDRTHNWVVVDD